MPLTDTSIRNTKAGDKVITLTDERGLSIQIQPNGGKWWRFRYRYAGKAKMLSLGTYPDVSLKEARERRDECRRLLANDIDPSQQKKAEQAAIKAEQGNSFEEIAREWFEKNKSQWVASHGERIMRRLERDVLPYVGPRAITEIEPNDLLECLRRIEGRGAIETAHRALHSIGQVFAYAIACGKAKQDISAPLKGALSPVKETHFASVTEPAKVAELLRAIQSYKGTLTVGCALRLAPLVFVRPGELRQARWEDIDLEAAEWRYLVTKTNTQHIVPLSRQAVAILKELQPLTGRSEYVFPSARSLHRPMSDNAVLSALRRMGIEKDEMSGHGFRAMARTILDEVLGFRPDFIEHQLAHAVRDPNGRAYNRTSHLAERKRMMQAWADYLDSLRQGAKILKFSKAA